MRLSNSCIASINGTRSMPPPAALLSPLVHAQGCSLVQALQGNRPTVGPTDSLHHDEVWYDPLNSSSLSRFTALHWPVLWCALFAHISPVLSYQDSVCRIQAPDVFANSHGCDM